MLGFCLYLLWPAQALAAALLRIVHAVPGVGKATVSLASGSGTVALGSVGFGQVTPWQSVRSGRFHWTLRSPRGLRLARGSATIGNGAYTGIVLLRPGGVALGIYRDQPGQPGTSLVRVIHAAPELGSPAVKFDSHVVATHLGYTQATPYLRVVPGSHAVAAMAPGHPAPVLSLNVKLKASLSYTAIVLGTRGQQVRVVTVIDRGAPLTRPAAAHPRRPRSAAASAVRASAGWVVVRPGDSLWRIARERLGPAASNSQVESELQRIWSANADRIGTGDPNLIFPGQRLHITV